jgi:hypothetical protein
MSHHQNPTPARGVEAYAQLAWSAVCVVVAFAAMCLLSLIPGSKE